MGHRRRAAHVPLESLLTRAAGGDEDAFASLYDTSAAQVFGVVVRVLRDPAQAEEVAQEVFLEVWQKAPSYSRELGGALTWLLTIAHRRAVDRVRSEQARRVRDERVQAGEVGSPFDEVAASFEDSEDRSRVAAALGKLTDLQRQAVELAYYGGHTYRQVAELLGAPLGTVKSRLRDGLAKLAELMEQER